MREGTHCLGLCFLIVERALYVEGVKKSPNLTLTVPHFRPVDSAEPQFSDIQAEVLKSTNPMTQHVLQVREDMLNTLDLGCFRQEFISGTIPRNHVASLPEASKTNNKD